MGYQTIHACVNDFGLFQKENENLEICLHCGFPRWLMDAHTKQTRQGTESIRSYIRYG